MSTKKEDYLKNLSSPLPLARLKKWPEGDIRQFWGENPALYAKIFGQVDDLHKFLSVHSGIDIATHHRDEVLAAQFGTVSQIKTNRFSLGGLVVYVNSPPLEDYGGRAVISLSYAHLDEISVKEGQEINKGDLIGYEGNTGYVVSGTTPFWGNAPLGVGTHLHFSGYEFVERNGIWTRRNEAVGGSFDLLPWLTGDWSGTKIMLDHVRKLLEFWLLRL